MKILLKISIPICLSFVFKTSAQIVFSENFGTGCSTGTLATTFGWTNTNTGTNQATANIWYVSAEERGMGAGNCGAACGGTNDRTLHLGAAAAAGGDLGAAYLESSAFICSFLGLCSRTDKRIESPIFNCTGVSNIPFVFDYLENGEGTNDNGTVWFSANGGTTWSLLDDPPKTAICGGGQGLWTTRTLTLPASADNNPNVRIGFRWVNNANGVGTDPSFAIDNIVIGTPISLGVEMVNMDVICNYKSQAVVIWTTQNEQNSSHFNVFKSSDGETWRFIDQVNSTNQTEGPNHYSSIDEQLNSAIAYYYIEQVDFDGKKVSYGIMQIKQCTEPNNNLVAFPNPTNNNEITFQFSNLVIQKIELFSIEGKKLKAFNNENETLLFHVNLDLLPGRYFAKAYSDEQVEQVMIIVN